MSIRWLSLPLCLILAAALFSGCAVDPIEDLQEALDSQKVLERQQAVFELKELDDERTVELLVEALEGDSELLEESGNALVLKGREWEEENPRAKKSEQNPVIEQLSQTIADMHLEAPVRTKACWVLGEIGNRRAIAALKGRLTDPSSLKVRAEATTSLKKLGYYGAAEGREMVADGQFVEAYDPDDEARGLSIVDEDEEADDEEAEEAAADDEESAADDDGSAADEDADDDEAGSSDEASGDGDAAEADGEPAEDAEDEDDETA